MRAFVTRIPVPLRIFLLFLAVFTWFFFTKWYCAADLVIRGTVPGKNGVLEVSWDGRNGYNGYELRRFNLDTIAPEGGNNHSVIIRYTGEKHYGSLSSDIVCSGLSVDRKALDLSRVPFRGTVVAGGSSILLSQPGDHIALDIRADESIELQLDTNNQSGKVEIAVNGRSRVFDLYYANIEQKSLTYGYWVVGPSGEFRVQMDMPRYRIRSLTVANANPARPILLDSVSVTTDQAETVLFSGNSENLERKAFRKISPLQKRYFHTTQVLFQLLFAGLTTWLISGCWRAYCHCRSSGGIFSDRRRVFWCFWLISILSYAVWLAAFWPGVMSVDSLKVWRAAVLPEVLLNDHPLLNVLLYRYLSGVWKNPAVVSIFHIVTMATLLSWIFYRIYRYGVSLVFLLPLYLLTVVSVPIGLYNVVLWKDIPFAALVVFWAFALGNFYVRKQEGRLHLSGEQLFALLLLLLCLAFTRHNGLIYLAVVPMYCVLLGLVPRRVVLVGLLFGGAGLAGVLLLLVNSHLLPGGDYLVSQGSTFLKVMFSKSPADIIARTWQNYWGIFDINQKDSAWDLFHYFLQDRVSYSFLIHAGWSDVYNYLIPQVPFPRLREVLMQLYWQSYETPLVYLSWNPVYFLGMYAVALFMFRRLPLTAIFSSFVLLGVFTLLVVIDIMNWRYYYFAFLGGYLLLPLMLLDITRGKMLQKQQVAECASVS